MTTGMFRQVVAPHESLLAKGTSKLLLPSVGSVVPCQLIRAGKLFKAIWPRAREWSFTCGKGITKKRVKRNALVKAGGLNSSCHLIPRLK